MNLFEYLQNYRNPNYDLSYGDILNKTSNIAETLSPYERAIYEHIKESDRQRLIKSGMPPKTYK